MTYSLFNLFHCIPSQIGWSGGAMVLGKLPMPRRPSNLDYGRTRAYCACSRCGRCCLDIFFSLVYHFSFLSLSLWETARYILKYCLSGPLSLKQPTNQPANQIHPRFQSIPSDQGSVLKYSNLQSR